MEIHVDKHFAYVGHVLEHMQIGSFFLIVLDFGQTQEALFSFASRLRHFPHGLEGFLVHSSLQREIIRHHAIR